MVDSKIDINIQHSTRFLEYLCYSLEYDTCYVHPSSPAVPSWGKTYLQPQSLTGLSPYRDCSPNSPNSPSSPTRAKEETARLLAVLLARGQARRMQYSYEDVVYIAAHTFPRYVLQCLVNCKRASLNFETKKYKIRIRIRIHAHEKEATSNYHYY